MRPSQIKAAPEGYSGTPLVKKLVIKPNTIVALENAPQRFEEILGKLPDGVLLRRNTRAARDLTIWFVQSSNELSQGMARIYKLIGSGKLWIAWPKKASSISTDLTESTIQKAGIAVGLVDYKVCAIDATWSGLLFTKRQSK